MRTQQLIAALIVTAAGSAMAQPATYNDLEDLPFTPTLTRAEVIADLNLWKRAGLDQFVVGESFDTTSAEYLRAHAVYQRLRSGPEYAAEVRRVAGQRNELAAVKTAPSAQ